MLAISTNNAQRTLAGTIDGFLLHIQHVRGLSSHTVFHYGHDLTLFLRFFARQEKVLTSQALLQDVKPNHVEAFLHFLTTDRQNSLRSAKRRLAALRAFFSYVGSLADGKDADGFKRLALLGNPAKTVPVPSIKEHPPRTFNREQVLAILKAARAHAPFPKRDYALLLLFLNCGVRLSEAINLKINHINLVEGSLNIDAGGPRERTIPLAGEARLAIAEYLNVRPKAACSQVFLNRYCRPITKGAVYHMLNRCLGAAGLSKAGINVHTLRHTCFTYLAEEGFTPEELQVLAGLRRPHIARNYVKIAKSQPDNGS